MSLPKSQIINTKRLILRFPSLDEIPIIFSATKRKGFNDGMLWDPPETEEELIIPHENIFKAWENDEGYNFSIIDKATDIFIGRISLRKEAEPQTWNIGFFTIPQFQNKGYMSEASEAIIDLGFNVCKADKIVACHALWNTASEKVLKGLGMIFSRYIEKGFQKNGIWVEENLLEITRSEWEKFNENHNRKI